jgi:hypothetical protein
MRKYFVLLCLFIFPATARAGIVVCDQNGVVASAPAISGEPVQGCQYYAIGQNIDSSQYNSLVQLIKTVDWKYLKMLNGFPVEMASAEKTAVDDALAAQIQAQVLSDARAGAKNSVDELSPEGVRLRAALLVVLDRFNTVTAAYDAIISCNVNNSTASVIRSCINAIPTVGQATAAQMKTAIKNKIDAGSAD